MTTPTNEAGHGLPEVAAAREVIRAYFAGELDDTMILNLSESLALSRGVPADMRGALEKLIEAADTSDGAQYGTLSTAFVRDIANDALAKTGGGGESLWCLHIIGPDDVHPAPSKAHAEKAAERLNDFMESRKDRHPLDPECRAVAAPWPHSPESHAESVERFIAEWLKPSTPQPAAADGGVRERAREIAGIITRNVCETDPADPGRPDTVIVRHGDLLLIAETAISAALSSHRQAGDESKFRELAEKWRANGHPYVSDCADELIALVEKGAGNG